MNQATLDTLIDLATNKCDAAQVRHANVQRSAEQARAHLEMLRQYAREYEERARWGEGQSRDPSAENNQTIFLARLAQAVEAQLREIEIREAAVVAASAELSACLQRRKSLETLALRRSEQERRTLSRRDQKNTDEYAQRAQAIAASIGMSSGAVPEGTGS